jgi:hypothetical protein
MVGRRRRPLLRGAMIGGLAASAGRSAERKAQHAREQESRLSNLEQDQAQAPAPPAPAAAGSSMVDQLAMLAQLHESGSLTDAEFEAAKSRLLAG